MDRSDTRQALRKTFWMKNTSRLVPGDLGTVNDDCLGRVMLWDDSAVMAGKREHVLDGPLNLGELCIVVAIPGRSIYSEAMVLTRGTFGWINSIQYLDPL